MVEFFAILFLGIFLGWLFRGALTKSRIAHVKDELREQQLRTLVEKERLAQDKMLDERSKG